MIRASKQTVSYLSRHPSPFGDLPILTLFLWLWESLLRLCLEQYLQSFLPRTW